MESKPKGQPSRHGKKAWRKNIDVDDIQAGLEAKRENEVLLGDDSDFIIDNVGDSKSKTPAFIRKTSEILANKSKVPSVSSRKVKHKVSKSQANRLMALAGRLVTTSKVQARSEKEGIIRASSLDVWGTASEEELPEVYKKTPFLSYTAAKKAPKTLSHQPVALETPAPLETVVHAGKSYNPDLKSWKDLINKEFNLENSIEMKRQEMEEHQKRIQYLIATLDDKEFEESDDEEGKEEEGVGENEDEDDSYKLSLNERTELKIKTKTRRNKEMRHKQRLELEKKLKDLKKQIRDLSNLETIESEVEKKLLSVKKRSERKYRRHGKHEVGFKPIEVKLSDELTSNLRTMKPEGNLLYDQMYKLQAQGKVAATVPQKHKRKAVKITEKWSYKDFK